uniref:Uncharacterized protein n=1 Tax=Solanum lycopersicum TaxID=4081 RepID=A0A3Q7G2P1_SOLLC
MLYLFYHTNRPLIHLPSLFQGDPPHQRLLHCSNWRNNTSLLLHWGDPCPLRLLAKIDQTTATRLLF